MSDAPTTVPSNEPSGRASQARVKSAATLVRLGMAVLVPASFFAAAGTIRWAAGWAFILVVAASLVVSRRYLNRHNPELVAVRRSVGEGTPSWDKAWVSIFWLTMLAIIAVGAFESRADPERIEWVRSAIGALGVVGGLALSTWAMGVNRHFEGTVRIQRDRDHHVVDAGPYRLVRHPGYVALILNAIGTGAMLGSRWVFVPALLAAVEIVVRTALEDRFLQHGLEGYSDYARRVRWRLLPGVW